MAKRRFPAYPGRSSRRLAGYRVDDATGQTIGWFYGEDETRRNGVQSLTRAKAGRFARAFARLPKLLAKDRKPSG